MREQQREHHATALTVDEHGRAIACRWCPARAEVAACWTFDGSRRIPVCRACAQPWADRHGVTLPAADAELLPAPQRLRLARPTLPARRHRPVPVADLIDDLLAPAAEPIAPEPAPDRTGVILDLIAGGQPDQHIAHHIDRPIGATKVIVTALLAEFGATNRPHVIHLAHRRGLLCQPNPAGEATVSIDGQRATVLALLAEGRTRNQIAEQLGVNKHSVDQHVNRLSARLGSGGAPVVVHQAHRCGILPCPCSGAPAVAAGAELAGAAR